MRRHRANFLERIIAKRIKKYQELSKLEIGFFYALPALLLAAFHMIVAYAIQGADGSFQKGDFIPGLFEGVIGVVMYGGLAACVIMAIVLKRFRIVSEFIGSVAAARLLLPVVGMIGGAIVIAFVIVGIFVAFVGTAATTVLSAAAAPVFGGFVGVFLAVFAVAHFLLPILGVLMIVGMVVSALAGAVEGARQLENLFTSLIPLL